MMSEPNRVAPPEGRRRGLRQPDTAASTRRFARPVPGDVVMGRVKEGRTSYYTVSTFPSPPQVKCQSRESALTTARVFANHGSAVVIWAEEEDAYRRVERALAHT